MSYTSSQIKKMSIKEVRRIKAKRRQVEISQTELVNITRDIFQYAPFGIYTINKDGYIDSFNPLMLKLAGAKKESEVVGLYALSLPTYVKFGFDKYLKRALRGEYIDLPEFRYISYTKGKESIRHFRLIPIKKGKKVERVLVLVEDITELHRSREKLKYYAAHLEEEVKKRTKELEESEKKYKNLVEKSLMGVYLFQGGKFRFVNKALAKIFGYRPEELIDKKGPLDLTVKEDRRLVSKNIKNRLSGKIKSVRYQFRGLRKDGRIIKADVWGSCVMYDGKMAIQGTLLDITEHARMQEALKESEEKYRILLEETPVGIYFTEGKKFRFVNEALAKIFGYKPKELINKLGPLDLTVIENHAVSKINAQKLLTGKEKTIRGEVRGIHKSGKIIDIDIWGTRTIYQGRPMVVGVVSDVTKRKQAEEHLRESEERFRAVAESAGDAIILSNNKGNIIFWNKAAEKMFGYGEKEILGKPEYFLMPERYRKAHLQGVSRLSHGGVPRILGKVVELDGLKKDGREFPIELSISRWHAQKNVFFTALVRDITERKRVEEEIERRTEELERFNKLAIGRELRMIELKNKISQLERNLLKYKKK